jgi:hypothetical protein
LWIEEGGSYRDGSFAIGGGEVKRRGVFAVLGGRVGVAREKLLDTLGAAARSSPVKRRVAVFVGKVGVGLGKEEEVDDVRVAFDGGPMQRGIAISVNLRHCEQERGGWIAVR